MDVKRTLDRRAVLKASGGLGLTGLAGCLGGSGGGGDRVPMDVTEWPPQDYAESMVSWNWYDDWVTWATEAFNKEYDVSVTNSGFSSPNQWYTKLQAGNSEIDNISGTTNWVDRSIQNDFLHELPVDVMPAWDNISSRIKEVSSYQQDGKTYAVPESLVLYPLTYNTESFSSAPSSWGVLWDEQHKGKIMMWDNSTVSCQIAALYTGQDPIQPSDYGEIEEVLKQQKPLLKTYWGDYEQAMQLFVNEDVIAGPLTMGRTWMARIKEGAPVHYTAPKEGAMFTSDLFIIPKGGKSPIASLLWTNWASKPANAVKLFKTMGYKPAVDISDQLSRQNRKFIQWPDSWKLIFQETLSEEVRNRYSEIWTAVKAA